MRTATARTAEYKGRTYRLAFIGDTKFGRRAKLQFFDGSREFWVAAELVRETSGQRRESGEPTWRGNGCSACRQRGDWCKSCYFDEFDC